jgi:hypothetical protein
MKQRFFLQQLRSVSENIICFTDIHKPANTYLFRFVEMHHSCVKRIFSPEEVAAICNYNVMVWPLQVSDDEWNNNEH